MIQFNLLPDVKLEYLKAQRARQMVTTISFVVSALAISLLVLLMILNALQKKHLNDVNRDIKIEISKLKQEPQINKVLTVQNQLESLTVLHDTKPAVSRLFDYLNQLTPNEVAITNFTMDTTQTSATITGSASALSSINQYVDTLKSTVYTTDNNTTPTKALNNVVLSSFGISSSTNTAKPANYTISFAYDKNIFDIKQNIKLTVPNITPTRVQPSDLFQTSANNSTSTGGH